MISETIADYITKLRRRGFSVFRYSDIGKIEIGINLVRLAFYELTGRRYVRTHVNNYEMVLDLKTPGLSRALLVYGKREVLDTYVVEQTVSKDMTILDVGANIGYYALMEATRLTTGRVYAIEPDPRNQELLRRNAALNGCAGRIQIFACAASDRTEKRVFHLGEKTNLSSMIARPDSVSSVEVECIKLDEFPHIYDVDFIRMDIEGFECKVLQGLQQFLGARRKPVRIFIEVHHDAYNDADMNFYGQVEHLLADGFRVTHMISRDRFGPVFSERGYNARRTGIETDIVRHLYQDIAADDAMFFLRQGVVRSVMLSSDRS